MRVIKSISTMQSAIKKLKIQRKKIGFVPTMGALHKGHLSLIQKCRRENDISVLSIFVNPKQFGPLEDFTRYPREEKKDEILAKKEKIDIIFYPSEKTMYPTGFLTSVEVTKISKYLCGQFRPGHFDGVTTVVLKLLNIVTPDILYLGQKDAQQAAVIHQMITDLNITTKLKICPIVREIDGLAMSSRNAYLSTEQRKQASVLYQSLKEAKQYALKKSISTKFLIKLIHKRITQNTKAKIEYIECVDSQSLAPLNTLQGKVMIALAVRFGKTRLIDNITFHIS